MPKVCESLGLAVRVHLCRGVFSQCNNYQMYVCDLFYSKNMVLSKSDHVCGSESCHEQRRLLRTSEKELMLLIRLEKFTKQSLRALTPQIHSQTDSVHMEEIQGHCYLPEKRSTNKDHSKTYCVIVCEVAKVPRVTSKQLKAFLTLVKVNVHEPTIKRTLSNHGVHGRVTRSHCSPKRKLLDKDHVDNPDDYWRKVLMD